MQDFPAVMSAAPAALPVVLADVKEQIKVYHTDDDTLISELIAQAVSYLDGPTGILGRCMIEQTWTQSFRTFPAGRWFRLAVPNVTAVAITYYDGTGAQQTLSASSYYVYDDYIGSVVERLSSATWPTVEDRPLAITAAMTAGFGATAADVPDGIKRAIAALVGTWFQSPEARTLGVAETESMFGLRDMIAPWRRVGV